MKFMFLYKLLIIQKLLKAKAHLGRRSKENVSSSSRPIVYGFRNKIAIIDLEKTLICLRRACNLIDLIIRAKGYLLFVNTNPEFNNIVQQTAKRTNQSFINHKWIGGFLTNWNHMQNVQKHFQDFTAHSLYSEAEGRLRAKPLVPVATANEFNKSDTDSLTFSDNTKKYQPITSATSLSSLSAKMMLLDLTSQPRFKKMQKSFEGCFSNKLRTLVTSEMKQPDCIVLLNANNNSTAILEASLLQIPIISIVDSNIPNKLHKLITYPIPANGDSLQFVHLICNCFVKTILSSQTRNRKVRNTI